MAVKRTNKRPKKGETAISRPASDMGNQEMEQFYAEQLQEVEANYQNAMNEGNQSAAAKWKDMVIDIKQKLEGLKVMKMTLPPFPEEALTKTVIEYAIKSILTAGISGSNTAISTSIRSLIDISKQLQEQSITRQAEQIRAEDAELEELVNKYLLSEKEKSREGE